jgi:hypothetical protein
MNLLGFDVGSEYGTAFFMDDRPSDLKGLIHSESFTPFQIHYCTEDLEKLLSLGVDCIILEPSGGYERVLLNWLERYEIPYRLANLKRIKAYRENVGIAKTDGTDAMILAAYGHDQWDDRSAWVKPIELKDLREKLFQRRSLTGMRRALIPKLRQWLHTEFPEAKDFVARREWKDPPCGLMLWLAGIEGKRYFALWQKKHDRSCGKGVTLFTRNLGKQILEIEYQLEAIEIEISCYLTQDQFKPYHQAFDQFGFSQLVRAWWLCRIYPFEQFLDEQGKPIAFQRLSRINQKPVTVHVSLGRFKCALGAGTIPNTSGIRGEVKTKYRKRKGKSKRETEYFVTGDRFCRESFFTWSDRTIPTGSLKSPLADQLRSFYQARRNQGKPYYKIMGALHGYTCRLLFRELVKALKFPVPDSKQS